MTGTENVNLTDTTGKYEMRVLTEFCCYFIVVCVRACVCVCWLSHARTVAALMSSARSHGRQRCLRSALPFTPSPPQPGPAWTARDVRMCLCVYIKKTKAKQTDSREDLNLCSSACACAGERNNADTQQSAHSSADGTQVFGLEVFIYHGAQPPVRSFLNMWNVFIK